VPPTISGGGAGYIEIYRWCCGAVPAAGAIVLGAEAWRARPAGHPQWHTALTRSLITPISSPDSVTLKCHSVSSSDGPFEINRL